MPRLAAVSTEWKRPEHEILIRCAGTRMTAERAGRLRDAIAQDINWPKLLRLARRHGMIPLLHHHLHAVCGDLVSQVIQTRLRDEVTANLHRNLLATAELHHLIDLFASHGIPAVAYKGPVLAVSVYGSLSLRQFRDLDILVRKHDALTATELLIAHGYRPDVALDRRHGPRYLRSQCDSEFERRDGRVRVDLHWGFTPPYFCFPFDPEPLWERLETIHIGGRPVRTFRREDLLLVLCAHGAKHLWNRLEWICSIAELIAAAGGMDWRYVMDKARDLGGRRMILLGVALAGDMLKAALPGALVSAIQADGEIEVLKRRVQAHLFDETPEPPDLFDEARFHLRARERTRDRVRYCRRLAMTTTARDWTSVRIPSALALLYYPVRAVRLTAKYGPRLLKRGISLSRSPDLTPKASDGDGFLR